MSDVNQWDYASPHIIEVCVGDHHIDGLGHTNNCEYLKWCEQAAWSHTESLGLGLAEFQQSGFGMAAVRTELDYLQATYTGDELLIGTWLTSSDGKLDTWRSYQIIRKQDRVTVLRGKTRFVCVSLGSGKLKRMPSIFQEAYLAALIEV